MQTCEYYHKISKEKGNIPFLGLNPFAIEAQSPFDGSFPAASVHFFFWLLEYQEHLRPQLDGLTCWA